GPHFHLAETLTAELRLATERLLGNERVRTDRTGVDLVVHEVVELEYVDVANRHLTIELFTRTPVEHGRLTRSLQTRLFKHDDDVSFLGAVEDRGRDRHALGQVLAETNHAIIIEIGDGGVARKQVLHFQTKR